MVASQDVVECLNQPTVNKEVVMATHEAIDFWVKDPKLWPNVTVLAQVASPPTTRPQGPVREKVCWHEEAEAIQDLARRLPPERCDEWQQGVDEAKNRLTTAMAVHMEEQCSMEPGALAHWAQGVVTKVVPLDQVLAKPRARKPKLSSFAYRVSGTLCNLAATTKGAWHYLKHGTGRQATIVEALDLHDQVLRRLACTETMQSIFKDEQHRRPWQGLLSSMAATCQDQAQALRAHDGTEPYRLAELEEYHASMYAWAGITQRMALRIVAYEDRLTTEGVRTWARRICEGGASQAHLWTKQPSRWKPEEAAAAHVVALRSGGAEGANEDGVEQPRIPNTGPVATLEAHRANWKGQWKASEALDEPAHHSLVAQLDHLVKQQEEQAQRGFPEEMEPKERRLAQLALKAATPLTGQQVFGASKAFKQHTSRATGIHPRHPSWLNRTEDDPGTRCVAAYLQLVEQTGVFATNEQLLITALYQKLAGADARLQATWHFTVCGAEPARQVSRRGSVKP